MSSSDQKAYAATKVAPALKSIMPELIKTMSPKDLTPLLEKAVEQCLREKPDDAATYLREKILQLRAEKEAAAAAPAPAAEPAPSCPVSADVVRKSLKETPGGDELLQEVLICPDCDYVDGKKRVVGGIDYEAIHGHSDDHLAVHKDRRESKHGGSVGGINALATAVVLQARAMSGIVASETPDVLHSQWNGPDGADPLSYMFGTEDNEELCSKLLELDASLRDLVKSECTLNRIPAPAKVFGDLHGQFRDLLMFLHHFGFPSDHSPCFVFNGDWVDRGKHQVEVLALVFALKLAHPSKVWLNRGNHEDVVINSHMGPAGFKHACNARLGAELGARYFASTVQTFEYLSIATVVAGRILVLHGGIGKGDWELSHLEGVERPLDDAKMLKDRVLYNALWSDPIDEDKPKSFGVHDSPRDGHKKIILAFGKDVTDSFCAMNRLGMIIRSHECSQEGTGYEVMHGGKLMRVFSARDYEGDEHNDGSLLSIMQDAGNLLVRPQILKSLLKVRK